MTYSELTAIRTAWNLTIPMMSRLLGVDITTHKRWKTATNEVPTPIEYSVIALTHLSKSEFNKIKAERGVIERLRAINV